MKRVSIAGNAKSEGITIRKGGLDKRLGAMRFELERKDIGELVAGVLKVQKRGKLYARSRKLLMTAAKEPAQHCFEQWAAVGFAGEAATYIRERKWDPKGARDDRAKVRAMFEDYALLPSNKVIPPDSLQIRARFRWGKLYYNMLRLRTVEMLSAPAAWSAVEALADALYQRVKLSGDEAANIVRRALREHGKDSPVRKHEQATWEHHGGECAEQGARDSDPGA